MMIWHIARHEWTRLTAGMLFWLLLGATQLLVAWLAFTQLEAFAAIAPQLQAAGSMLNATDLVIEPTLSSLILILLLAMPLLAMGSLAGEARSGRMEYWLAAPVGIHQIVLGKALGLWITGLPLLSCTLLSLAVLGQAVQIDWQALALAACGLLLFGLWLSSFTLMMSAMFDHPAAAFSAAVMVLIFLWLLDSFGNGEMAWYGLALLPHVKPWLQGLLQIQDLVYFLTTGGACLLAAMFVLAQRRGEV
jgi:ABC-2 type transport system permease protein